MATINIYRLYDPLAIQLLQLNIEGAACATPTGGFMPGFTTCTIGDNGFWILDNELTEGGELNPKLKTLEDAAAAAQIFMRDFDIAMQGGRPTRALNANEQNFDWGSVNAKYQPKQTATSGNNDAAKGKPKFFEYASFIGGRMYDDKQLVNLNYGFKVAPNKGEEAILVENFSIEIDVFFSGVISSVRYNARPVLKVEQDKMIIMKKDSERDADVSLAYIFDDAFSVISPFYLSY